MKNKIVLALMLAGVLVACGKKEEAKPEEVKQEAISQAEMPKGAKITNDTETPIEEPKVEGEKPTTLGTFEAVSYTHLTLPTT